MNCLELKINTFSEDICETEDVRQQIREGRKGSNQYVFRMGNIMLAKSARDRTARKEEGYQGRPRKNIAQ